jgi:ankyrin repeat protein
MTNALRIAWTVCLIILATSAAALAEEVWQPTPQESLEFAARRGSVESASAALAAGADVHGTDDRGRTPLMEAAFNAQLDVARLLLERGAKVDARDDVGFGALHYAVLSPMHEGADAPGMVRLLLEHGADPNIGLGEVDTPLHRSVFYAPPVVWQLLLDHGAQIDAKNIHGLMPLHFAASYGRAEAVEFLAGQGAPIEDVYLAAATDNHTRLVKLLSDGQNLNEYDWQGRSVLDWARANKARRAVALLVALGAKTGAELTAGRANVGQPD